MVKVARRPRTLARGIERLEATRLPGIARSSEHFQIGRRRVRRRTIAVQGTRKRNVALQLGRQRAGERGTRDRKNLADIEQPDLGVATRHRRYAATDRK